MLITGVGAIHRNELPAGAPQLKSMDHGMPNAVADRPRIVAPPPVIYLGVLAVGLMLEWLWPTRVLNWPSAVGAGSAMLVLGVAGVTAAIRTVRRARTPIDPYRPTTAIVTNGLYRHSRNPIYVSDTLIYVGLSLALNAWWALALTPVLIWMLLTGVIEREERYLEGKFGDEYLQYKRQVRRWL